MAVLQKHSLGFEFRLEVDEELKRDICWSDYASGASIWFGNEELVSFSQSIDRIRVRRCSGQCAVKHAGLEVQEDTLFAVKRIVIAIRKTKSGIEVKVRTPHY